MSNIEQDHDPSYLGGLEKEILEIIWRNGDVTAETVRAELARPLKESTVRTVLNRLEKKGYLLHHMDNRTFVYSAAEPKGKVAARAVKRIADWLFNGSMEDLLVGIVEGRETRARKPGGAKTRRKVRT